MNVAILSIGTELTRGEIADTNAAFLASSLSEAGFTVTRSWIVDDDDERIVLALTSLGRDHGLVVVSGGLGPTSDDITAKSAARAAERPLVRDESALLAIRRRLEARGKTVSAYHEKQADIPEGAEVLNNSDGTAPGFSVRIGGARFYFMPGVPREMKRMFREQVLPRIKPQSELDTYVIRLRTFGLPESAAAELLEGVEEQFQGVQVGYRVHFPELDIKVMARGRDADDARSKANEAASYVREALGDVVYGEGDDSFADLTGRALRQSGKTLALAESCTGGLVSHLLTSFAGASDFLVGGTVVYANRSKTKMLDVSEDTLRGHGAVSAEVAAEMAQGIRRLCGVDMGLAITGIAGPTGGSAQKPVGLVYWAVALGDRTVVRERVFFGDRGEIQLHAAYSALDLVRRLALTLPLGREPPMSQRPPSL